MKTRFLALVCLVVCLCPVNAQRRAHFDLDYHYFLGLSQRMLGQSFSRSDYDGMNGHSARFAVRYDFSQRLSAGLGIGVDAYDEYNAAPVYATCRYNLIKGKRLYAYGNLGYSIGSGGDSAFGRGLMFDVGVGYPLMITRNFGVNLQFGYNLSNCRELDYTTTVVTKDMVVIDGDYTDGTRHSLSFGIGLTF